MTDDLLTGLARTNLYAHDETRRMGTIHSLVGKLPATYSGMPPSMLDALFELIYSLTVDDGEQPAHWARLVAAAPREYIDAVVTGLEEP